jgi:hypothetical protein
MWKSGKPEKAHNGYRSFESGTQEHWKKTSGSDRSCFPEFHIVFRRHATRLQAPVHTRDSLLRAGALQIAKGNLAK